MTTYVKTNYNGEIIGVLKIPEPVNSSLLTEDLIRIEDDSVQVNIDTHYISSTGTLTEYTLEQQVKRKQRPNYKCYWEMALMNWVDQRTVSELKLVKSEDINKQRETRNLQPIEYVNTKFDANETSQSNLRGWINVLNAGGTLPENFIWRDFYDVDHPADAAWLIGLHTAIINRTTLLYQRSWELKQQLEAIPDNDLVAVHAFQTGSYTSTGEPNWPGISPPPAVNNV